MSLFFLPLLWINIVWIYVLAPSGLSAPLAAGFNGSALNISWQPPAELNGPVPEYTVRRQIPAFNYPPQPVEAGTRFMGAGYYRFSSDTIPQGVTFTGSFANIYFYVFDSFGEDIMLSAPITSVRSSVRSFVYPDRSCYNDISWTALAISMKLNRNNQWPLLMI